MYRLSATAAIFVLLAVLNNAATAEPAGAGQKLKANAEATGFFERSIRPLLVKHCYECHSEEAQEQQGGLLLDRRSGWTDGGDTGTAVVPGQPGQSLLIQAVRYTDDNVQMPPDGKLSDAEIKLLEKWIRDGAVGGAVDIGETGFSRLGDQTYIFEQAKTHWAFQPIKKVQPPRAANAAWNLNAIDQFIAAKLAAASLKPTPRAEARTLLRRLSYDLTGLPPTMAEVETFTAAMADKPQAAVRDTIDRLLASPAFGQHIARMWLDVARYGDTDNNYRPDTKTPHYFPFAFTYRDYVVDAFNSNKPYDQFLREQFAADLMQQQPDPPSVAALGFLATGPYLTRNQAETVDDWIDVTTRGVMGLTVACARCHDHKYEPVPTSDYYSLAGVFSSVRRHSALADDKLPVISGYSPTAADLADYEKKRAAIDKKIKAASGKKANNNLPLAVRIRDTELAQLLAFHPGAPAHAMVVEELNRPRTSFIAIRGVRSNRGPLAPRRFLKVLDPQQPPFTDDSSGRLELAGKITSQQNPLTARVFVNRIWGLLMGSYLVDTPSDFGLQGARPSHPQLLDWLADDFMSHGWNIKRLVKTIAMSRTYQLSSRDNEAMLAVDPTNQLLWRGNRKRLSIEALRDSLLAVSMQLDTTAGGRPAPLWANTTKKKKQTYVPAMPYTRRRSIYGFINRFNLDPTLRVFDFPAPLQSQGRRGESIVAPQSLFSLNAPFVVEQSVALTKLPRFAGAKDDAARVKFLFEQIYQRRPAPPEVTRISRFVALQRKFFVAPRPGSQVTTPWPLVAQAMFMANEFHYID